ncbi:MAG: (2Fe-2S)-binding protein [Austwickia sp.]|jgi:aerobic-type carbon monoxide dehydrogenase small subunit (CoxS/CutS family)|nr:(2Fe-2S)-binding protein [Austwickia sp.]
MHVKVTINGELYERDTREYHTLLEFLRGDAGLTGTKEGCAAGECGACTVIFNGAAVNACMVLAAEIDGSRIETIEGEATDGILSDLQAAFVKHQSIQCGFCTPGMVMSIRDLIRVNPTPSVAEIKERIEGNFCRCTGYVQIIEAVLDVTGQLNDETRGELRHV